MSLSNFKHFIPLVLVVLVFGIFLTTICPTVYLGDSGELTAAAFSLGIPHNSGYPLYTLLGKLFCLIPIGNIGFRMNLMSSVFAVLTLWLVYSYILKTSSSNVAAIVATLLLAFSPVFWWQTVCAEVYTLHAFFVMLLIRLLWEWDEKKEFFLLALFVFVTGISFGNHMQTVMLAPAVLFIVLSGDKRTLLNVKYFMLLSLLFFLALSLYLYLPIRTEAGAAIHWGDPNTFERFLAHVTARAHRGSYVVAKSPFEYMFRAKETLWFVCIQFGVVLLLAIWGWLKLSSIRWRIFFTGVVLFDFVYAIFLNIISLEITAFTIPSSVVLSILAGNGIADILKLRKHYHGTIGDGTQKMIKAAFFIMPVIGLLFNFNLCNQSRNYTAYEHLLNIFRTLDSGSTLFMDGDNNIFPVTYGRIAERVREDVTLYDRYNLFFKMPYMDDRKGRFTFYGKWEDLRAILEKKIIEKTVAHGVYFAVFNPFAISIPEQYRLHPFGILFQVLGGQDDFDTNMANKVWSYYSTESLHSDFKRDYMNREVSAYFYFNKGRYFFAVGAPDTGLKYTRAASIIGYNDDMIHSDIALLLTDHEFFEEARSELEKALEFHGDLSGILNNWGYYFSKLKDYDKAIDSFRKAIALNPKNYLYYNNLAFNLYEAGKKKEAFLAFNKSLTIKGSQPKINKFIKEHGLGQKID